MQGLASPHKTQGLANPRSTGSPGPDPGPYGSDSAGRALVPVPHKTQGLASPSASPSPGPLASAVNPMSPVARTLFR